MMRLLNVVPLAAGLFILVQAAHAQQLWTEAEVGMSVEEVRAVFPEAIAPDDPSHLETGDVEKLMMEGPAISGEPFIVRFYFAAEKLSQVTLNSPLTKSALDASGLI